VTLFAGSERRRLARKKIASVPFVRVLDDAFSVVALTLIDAEPLGQDGLAFLARGDDTEIDDGPTDRDRGEDLHVRASSAAPRGARGRPRLAGMRREGMPTVCVRRVGPDRSLIRKKTASNKSLSPDSDVAGFQ
jgi:hypothetical protein